jgi:hypothetical protein
MNESIKSQSNSEEARPSHFDALLATIDDATLEKLDAQERETGPSRLSKWLESTVGDAINDFEQTVGREIRESEKAEVAEVVREKLGEIAGREKN